jgi:hypothetical protein
MEKCNLLNYSRNGGGGEEDKEERWRGEFKYNISEIL